MTEKDVSDEFVESVSEKLGMYPGAWDMIDPKEIVAAVINTLVEICKETGVI